MGSFYRTSISFVDIAHMTTRTINHVPRSKIIRQSYSVSDVHDHLSFDAVDLNVALTATETVRWMTVQMEKSDWYSPLSWLELFVTRLYREVDPILIPSLMIRVHVYPDIYLNSGQGRYASYDFDLLVIGSIGQIGLLGVHFAVFRLCNSARLSSLTVTSGVCLCGVCYAVPNYVVRVAEFNRFRRRDLPIDSPRNRHPSGPQMVGGIDPTLNWWYGRPFAISKFCTKRQSFRL